MQRHKTQTLPAPTESAEQITLFQWAVYHVHDMPELALLHHIPNGGLRNKITAKRLQAEGVKAGVPDVCLPVSRGGYHGLYIELKRVGGSKPTNNQNKWIAALENEGYRATSCYGWEAASRIITEYLKLA